jgi:hypothetical protein
MDPIPFGGLLIRQQQAIPELDPVNDNFKAAQQYLKWLTSFATDEALAVENCVGPALR